jgi:hypothetical protein
MGACSDEVGGGVELDLGEAKGDSKDGGLQEGSGKPSEDPVGKGGKVPGPSSSKDGSKTTRNRTSATEDGGGEDDGSSAFAPAAGTYVYDQSGFEEFCDATECERQDLPPTQQVATSHKDGSGEEVVVVTEAESSDSRYTRTTTRHTRRHALITNVYVRFNYEGFSFNNSYQPDPPVESVRYPLQEGSSWSGEWKDSTSGDYSIAVGASRSVTVGNATVQAYPVRTRTTFTGEFEGNADVITWIDPATAAVVKIEGELRVKSVFGRYASEFSATLRSAPGY